MKSALVFAPRLCSLHPLSTLSSINRNIYPAKPSSFVSLSISLAFSFSPRLTSTRVSTVNLFLNYKDFQLAGSELMTFFIHASQGTQLEVDRLLNLNIFFPSIHESESDRRVLAHSFLLALITQSLN